MPQLQSHQAEQSIASSQTLDRPTVYHSPGSIASTVLDNPVSSQLFDIASIPTPQVFTHICVMRHPVTEDEQTLTIETLSDRFVDVTIELAHQRVIHGLFGYVLQEVLADYDAF